jgi:hypothetical protein
MADLLRRVFAARKRTEARRHKVMAGDAEGDDAVEGEGARRRPTARIRSIILFLSILTVVKNRVALIRRTFTCSDLQIGFPLPGGCHVIFG